LSDTNYGEEHPTRSAMRVILPVAGVGSRMRPLTDKTPKALIPVGGETLLGRALRPLARLRPRDVVLVVGHLGDQIEAWARDVRDLPIRIVRQDRPLGQSHAIAQASEYLEGPILILFCDTLHDADLPSLFRLADHVEAGGARGARTALAHDDTGANASGRPAKSPPPDGVLHVHPVDDPSRFGVAVIDSEGRVVRLVEKPEQATSDLAVVGVYYVRDGAALREAIATRLERGLPDGGEHYLADALQAMIDGGARFEARRVDTWLDCGTLADLYAVEGRLRGAREHEHIADDA